MALPTGEKTAAVIENEEAIADQKEALAEVIQEAEAESGSTEIQESEASSALAKSSGIQGNPLQELEEQGSLICRLIGLLFLPLTWITPLSMRLAIKTLPRN